MQGARGRWVKSMSLESWVRSSPCTPLHHKELISFPHYRAASNAKRACWSTALGVRRKGRRWLAPEENAEELTQVHVVWSLLEPQATAVVQVHGKFRWETLRTRQDICFSASGLKSPPISINSVSEKYPFVHLVLESTEWTVVVLLGTLWNAETQLHS